MVTPTSKPAGRKVGELAAAAGLTVRTLHYYEEVGLLTASRRTDSGHRLYSAADVERLTRSACSAGWACRWVRSAGPSTIRPGTWVRP